VTVFYVNIETLYNQLVIRCSVGCYGRLCFSGRNIFKVYAVTNVEKLRALTELLTDPALKIYNNTNLTSRDSYRESKTSILNKLVLNDNAITARANFNKRKQEAGKSVESFFVDLGRLVKIAHPDLIAAQLETSLLDQFIDGLKNSIRKFILSVGVPGPIRSMNA